MSLLAFLFVVGYFGASATPAKRFLPNGEEEARAVVDDPSKLQVVDGSASSDTAEVSVQANIDQEVPMSLPVAGSEQAADQLELGAVEQPTEADEEEIEQVVATKESMEQDVPIRPGVEQSSALRITDNVDETKDDSGSVPLRITDNTVEETKEDSAMLPSTEKEVEMPLTGEKPLDQVVQDDKDELPVPGKGSGFDLNAVRAGLKCALFKDCSETMDDADEYEESKLLRPTSILRKTHRKKKFFV